MATRNKSPKNPDDTEEIQPDIMPEPLDDTDPPAAERHRPPESDPQPEDPLYDLPAVGGDEGRDEISRRYREMRDQENAKTEPAVNEDEDADVGEDPQPDPMEEDVDDSANGPEPESVEAEPEKNEDLITIKIDGEIRELSLEEVKVLAQKNGAADKRFEEATSLRNDLKALKAELTGDHTAQPPAEPDQLKAEPGAPQPDDPSSPEPTIALDDEQLDSIVERVQTGEEDDGKQALRDFAEMIATNLSVANPAASADQVQSMVQETLVNHQLSTELDTALTSFRQNHPDLVDNQYLETAGMDATAKEMLEDLKNVGLPDEHLRALDGDPKRTAAVFKGLKAQGHNLRSYSEVLEATAENLRTAFKMPKPRSDPAGDTPEPRKTADKVTRQTREDRKRALPKQPRTAAVRDQAPRKQRPKTAQDIIQQKRAERHFPQTG